MAPGVEESCTQARARHVSIPAPAKWLRWGARGGSTLASHCGGAPPPTDDGCSGDVQARQREAQNEARSKPGYAGFSLFFLFLFVLTMASK